jgi:hypothetical protein
MVSGHGGSTNQDKEEHERLRKLFGFGHAGDAVPIVDPEDVKVVWEIDQESVKGHPQGNVAIGMEIFRRACKPAANVPAVTYRTGQICILRLIQPDVMDPLIQDKPKAVFRAAAEIPMEWMGVGTPRHGLPFDAEDFLRRVREAA